MEKVYLRDLPVELLYRIFDHLDTKTILRSLRPVCQSIYKATNTYHRFNLNFVTLSKSEITFITTHLVELDHIRSITFSDTDEKRLEEIEFFLSEFDIQQFSGLASIVFGQIDEQSRQTLPRLLASIQQTDFERYASRSTVLLIERGRGVPMIANGPLLRSLRFSNLIYVAQHILSPCQHTLQHLTISLCTYGQYRIILRSLPNLRKLTIDYCIIDKDVKSVKLSPDNQIHQQLRFLTILNYQMPVEYLRLILLLTPLLVYLKLVSARLMYDSVFDGSFWEQLIRTQFTQLQQFEFFFVSPLQQNAPVRTISSIIDTFRTPFWLVDKRWHTTCNHVLRSSDITLYTIPFLMNDDDILVGCKASPVNSGYNLFRYRTNEKNDVIAEETLTELNLQGYTIGDLGVQYLADELQDKTMLTVFDLRFNLISDEGAHSLALILERNNVFTTLDLRGNQISEEGLKVLSPTLQMSTTLTTLHLGNNRIDVSSVRYLTELLRVNSTLRILDLQSNQIKDQGTQDLADGLTDNKGLTTLSLRFNRIGNNGTCSLALALERNSTLTTLDLGGNHLGMRGVQLLAKVLTKNTTLTTLNLAGNDMGTHASRYLAEALPSIKTLIALDLSHNQITNEGARWIGGTLAYNTSLRALQLSGNYIVEDGGLCLADALQNNKKLLTLDLSSNSISSMTMQMIHELLLRNSQLYSSN